MANGTNEYLAAEYNQIAKHLCEKGDYANAVALYVKVLEIDHINDAAVSALAFYCLRPKEELDRAKITPEIVKRTAHCMHAMITKYRQSRVLPSRIFSTCAMLYQKIGDKRMTFYYYSLAWRAAPDNPMYPVQMAEILCSGKNYGEAMMLCHHALEIDPTYAYAYYVKGVIDMKNERYSWAVEALETFVSLSAKDDPLAKEIMELLSEVRESCRKPEEKPAEPKEIVAKQTELFG